MEEPAPAAEGPAEPRTGLMAGEPEPVRKQGSRLWVLKALYFLLAGSSAGLRKFLPVFYHNLGYSASGLALFNTVGSLASFAGSLIWGQLADWTGRYKQIIVVTAVLAAGLVAGHMWRWVQQAEWRLMGLTVLFSLFNSCTGSLIDSVTVLFVKAEGASYGEQRLWAAVGWGGMNAAAGALVDQFGMNSIFYVFIAAIALVVGITQLFFANPPKSSTEPDRPATASARMLCRPAPLLLFANLLVTGTMVAFVESFLLVYMAEVYRASSTLMGCSVLVMTVFEIPVFHFEKRLVAKVGIQGLITLAHLLYAVRVYCYTLIPLGKPWMFLLLEPTHGLVFAGMWVASVEAASRLAPASGQGLMQAVIGNMYYLLGVGVVGTLLAGQLIERGGGGARGYHLMYKVGAVGMLGWSLLWNLASLIIRRCCVSEHEPVETEEESGDGRKLLLPPGEDELLSEKGETTP